MPSFLDCRTASFYTWPQGPHYIRPDALNDPFYLAQGNAYYFVDPPVRARLPEGSPYPGMTVSIAARTGGSVEVEDDRGDPVETLVLTPDNLVTYTYINYIDRWKRVKI